MMIVEGSNVSTSFIQESGLTTPITTTLAKYQAAILPMGSLHYVRFMHHHFEAVANMA